MGETEEKSRKFWELLIDYMIENELSVMAIDGSNGKLVGVFTAADAEWKLGFFQGIGFLWRLGKYVMKNLD